MSSCWPRLTYGPPPFPPLPSSTPVRTRARNRSKVSLVVGFVVFLGTASMVSSADTILSQFLTTSRFHRGKDGGPPSPFSPPASARMRSTSTTLAHRTTSRLSTLRFMSPTSITLFPKARCRSIAASSARSTLIFLTSASRSRCIGT